MNRIQNLYLSINWLGSPHTNIRPHYHSVTHAHIHCERKSRVEGDIMALPLSDLLLFGSGEKKLAACLLLLLLELFMEGESTYIFHNIIFCCCCTILMFKYTSFQPGADASSTNQDINNHLELGKEFLARGQLSDALTHYHAAVGK